MNGLTEESWFWWAVALVVAAPLVLVLLSELVDWLDHRGSPFGRPVRFLRTTVLPLGWLVLLLVKVAGEATDTRAVRLASTALGFCLLVFALALLTAGLFASAERTTWRAKMPTIFVDLARLLLIIVGGAILFSVVWGYNVGGLVTALGVTSIVIGLALQNAVGNVVSGLLLLFEQPFTKGDVLDVNGKVGRVVEVNWRSLHLDLGNAVHIVPNGSLATASFANLSRPSVKHDESVELEFATEEAPNAVKALLDGIAAELPGLDPASRPSTALVACNEETMTYATSFTLAQYTGRATARDEFLTRAWYGARRRGLRLRGLESFSGDEPDRVAEALAVAATHLQLSDEDVAALTPGARIEEFAAGEEILRPGTVPAGMSFVLRGHVELQLRTSPLGGVTLETLSAGDFFGQRMLTREAARSSAIAVEDVDTLLIDHDALVDVLHHHLQLARDLEEVRDRRRAAEREALDGDTRSIARANGTHAPAGSA